MTEEIYIEEAGTEREGLCKGKIVVVFSDLPKKRKENLYSYVSGAIKAMKNCSHKGHPETLKNYKPKEAKKPEEEKVITIRGRHLTSFLTDLNVAEEEVVGEFRSKFPNAQNDPVKVLNLWRKLHPKKIEEPKKPQKTVFKCGDKVRYRHGSRPETNMIGTVEDVGGNLNKKMLVRFGINDTKYVFPEDYVLVNNG